MPGPDDLHRPGTEGYRRLNLAMLGAGLAAFGLLYATQPVLPEIAEEFGATAAHTSLTVSASTGVLAVAVVPVTALASRWGRVRTMRVGLLLAAVLGLACAAAPTLGVLVALRGLLGLVLAGVVAVAMGHVGAEVHPSGLGAAMGLYVAGNSLGGVGGRLITAGAADVGSWRLALALLALAALVATAVFWRLLPAASADGRGSGVSPRAFRALLRDPAVLALVAVPFLLMGGFVAVYNFLTFRLVAPPFSLPVALVGLVFLAYLAGTTSSALAGRAADRVGRPVVLVGAVVVMLAGLLLTLPGSLPAVVVGLVVLTAGFFAAHAVASGWAPVVGGAHGTQASALYVCGYYAGSSIFGAWVGTAWTSHGWPGVVTWVAGLVALALACGLYVAHRTRRG
ncbi:MFS transporter [Nocardioides sp. ChNu-153]|uniref:MFS transporter n=1 Tax=Nocardioides sp. ChNu-153 TaxID=2779364 RepID=UPI0026536DD8|nr:MFS transporter [Nocardioides sp. ChNu-153]MDN7120983.1 MFS transporter [Nocardioides sp. ChNu-153]